MTGADQQGAGEHLLDALRVGYAVALLGRPARLLSAVGGDPHDRWQLGTARLLGARELLQVLLVRRFAWRHAAGAATEAVHAASLLPVISGRVGSGSHGESRRRAATASAAVASAFAAVETAVALA